MSGDLNATNGEGAPDMSLNAILIRNLETEKAALFEQMLRDRKYFNDLIASQVREITRQAKEINRLELFLRSRQLPIVFTTTAIMILEIINALRHLR